MQVITETELLDRIREFLDRHEMAPTTFGRKATGNANLVKELEDGKSPSLRTVQKVANFMAEVDAEAATRAKLNAPLEPLVSEEASDELPFSQAPVNPTGAASPISSSTIAPPITPAASDSSQASSEARNGSGSPSPSCSAEQEA